MDVVFEFPCVTAFVIRVSAAEMSDTGAECALDALEGAIGGGGEWNCKIRRWWEMIWWVHWRHATEVLL